MRGPAAGTLMTLQEAADCMGICLKTAAETEQRALAKLREALEEFRGYESSHDLPYHRVSRRPLR
jgi:hypothetical protein